MDRWNQYSHVIIATILSSRCYFSHFTKEETRVRGVRYWPKITQLVNWIRTQACRTCLSFTAPALSMNTCSSRLSCVWGKLWCSEFSNVLPILLTQLCIFLLVLPDPKQGRFSANSILTWHSRLVPIYQVIASGNKVCKITWCFGRCYFHL